MEIDFKKIESKWQKRWEQAKAFVVKEGKGKKFYVLEMYPYPSSSGLHMGHAFNYTIGDVLARFKRMSGFNVLYPMGYDSFGLPAENAAIKAKMHPRNSTNAAIKNYIRQQKELGLSYDWSRMLMSHDENYYKWNQFFFLKFLEKGLAYRKKAPVNWCPKCNTVLANEQVQGGKCWRHEDTEVETRQLEQWFLRTTAYADELLDKVDDLQWPERIKLMQKNWIGKSYGVNVFWKVKGQKDILKTFTTTVDTMYGVTFLVISPEHPLLNKLITKEQEKEVSDYLKKIKNKTDLERTDLNKDKSGVFIGSYVINPLTEDEVPIFVADYVLMNYGTGVVMGVPAHDQRDKDFAEKYDISVKQVLESDGESFVYDDVDKYHVKGVLINSGEFDGLSVLEGREAMTKKLEKMKMVERTVQYKLKDWLISRQRYWGTPIPVVYCDKCGVVPVPEKDLPVKLPMNVKFGKGNPLATNEKFLNVKCPKCGGRARRETDTMDTFVDSSWYYLRYADSKNVKKFFDKKKVDYWLPVDQYIGGAEHACLHLLYARFWTKALRDLGYVNFGEPFTRLFNQGMLHGPDGDRMSKSKGNVVLPESVSKKYGIDTARLFLMSVASPDKDLNWSEKGIEGSLRFVRKVMNYFEIVKVGKSSAKIESKLNKTIKEVTNQIENFKYNLAVIKIRDLFNSFGEEESKDVLEKSLKLLHPFCPHITEELWEKLGHKKMITLEGWPKVEEKKIDESLEREDEMVRKLKQDIEQVKKLTGKDKAKVYVYVLPNELNVYKGVEGIELFAVNDRKKHDPENKSKKVKPNKPAIFLE